jgi:hypothetical protein
MATAVRLPALAVVPIGIVLYYVIFSYTLYMVGLALLAGIAVVLMPRANTPWRECMPLLAMYAWWWVTVIWSPDADAAFYLAVAGVYVLFGVVAAAMKERLGEFFPLRLIMLCGLAFVICAIYSRLSIGDFIDLEKGSMRTIFSAFFLAAMPAATYFALQHRSVFAGFVLLLMLGIGFQLGSRTFFLLSIPAVFLTAMVVWRTSPFLRLAQIPLMVLVAVAVGGVMVEAAASSGSDVFEAIERRTSLQVDEATFWEARNPQLAAADLERRLLVVVGLDSFSEHPLVGAGYYSTPFYMGQYYRSELTAHGFPLFLLGETGLIGTLLCLIVLWLAARGYRHHAKQLPGEQATVAYVELITLGIIVAVGLFHQVYSDFYLYLFLGIGYWRLFVSKGLAQNNSRQVGFADGVR